MRFVCTKMDLGDFTGSHFREMSFVGVSGLALQLGGCSIKHVRFRRCRLDQAVFVGSRLVNVSFEDCELPHSFFTGVTLGHTTFVGCNLHGADLDFLENLGCSFDDCNLWGAKASLGCQFFNSTFDARTADRFAAMLARVHPDPGKRAILEGVAGKELAVVKRLMDRRIPEEGSWPRPEESDGEERVPQERVGSNR